jgi:Ribonuclease G/E
MASELLINVGAGEARAALVEDGVLQAYATEPVTGGEARMGTIYMGRVTRVMTAMHAAFVDIGQERDGFLSLRDAPALYEGMALAVQVTRPAMGEKGAKLTARVMLTPELQARAKMAKPPALLAEGPDLAQQVVCDWKADQVFTDDARAAQRLQIGLAKDDLFLRHDLEDQVAALYRPRVALACGGWITIEKTEGLTAIDVNSGGFAASGGRAETARVVNLEAAAQAGRQIRLRGIGGLIVLDFIQTEQGEAVTAALRDTLARDPAHSEILPMNSLGIVCIARQRLAAPLPPRDMGYEILRAIERSARAAPGREVTVRAAPEITARLERLEIRAGLDRRGVGRVRYISEARGREDFDVGT